jgi:proteasome lid subunit RPN8/RPN11
MSSDVRRGLVLTGSIRAQLAEVTGREAPKEAVGLLGGSRDVVSLVLPLTNCSASEDTFFADPHEQYLAEQELQRQGLEIVGTYHSHPDGAPVPSATDATFAAYWSCPHLIVVPPSVTSIRARWGAWIWREGVLLEAPIRLV